MDSMTEDILTIILVRLPLKSITTSKLVCKQWKSILESPFLRKLFLSRHQNSHSMWSLIVKDHQQEAVAHYGCEIWGHPPQQLGSYIVPCVTQTLINHEETYSHARVVAYTDVGLILIRVVSVIGNASFYVANPVSRECVETSPPWFETKEYYGNLGLATRTDEYGAVLGYKVVLLYDAKPWTKSFNLLVYSSETGLWRQETVQFPYSFHRHVFRYSISLNGNLHWRARNNVRNEVVVSIDFYDTGSDHPVCHVTHFPDLKESPRFKRSCTVSQGSLMYMNVVSQGKEHQKLRVWRLESSWKWKLVSQISYDNDGNHYFPLAINPFDAETVYFWSNEDTCLVSMNLRIGKFVLHGKLERSSSNGCILKSFEGETFIQLAQEFSSFVLPKWVYRIPNTVTNSRQPKSSSNPTFIWWRKTPQPSKDPAHSSNTFLTSTREEDKLNSTCQNIEQKQSVKSNSFTPTAHQLAMAKIAMANRFSILEDYGTH